MRALPVTKGSFDAVISGLALNFAPAADQPLAASEMSRVLRPGGILGACLWDYAEGMALMRQFWDAAVALDPAARDLDEGARFPICRPEPLAALFRAAGLNEVEVRAADVPARFRDFDDYWAPFLGGQGPASSYVSSLPAVRLAELRERIRAGPPVAADGSIPLTFRAWAARGRRSA